MKYIIIFLLLTVKLAYSQDAPPPNEAMLQEPTKVMIAWNWSRGNIRFPDAKGFRVWCGPDFNNYTEMIDIPDKTARNYLVGPIMLTILNNFGTANGPYKSAVHVHCIVSSYNDAGDSWDGGPSVPLNPSNIHLEILK